MDMDSREKHFWNHYLVVLAEQKIESSLYTWYVGHCETFTRGNKDTRLKQHTKKPVSGYLRPLHNTATKEK